MKSATAVARVLAMAVILVGAVKLQSADAAAWVPCNCDQAMQVSNEIINECLYLPGGPYCGQLSSCLWSEGSQSIQVNYYCQEPNPSGQCPQQFLEEWCS